MAPVRDHGRPLVEDPARLERVDALGLDETVMLHAGPRRHTTYVIGFVESRTSKHRQDLSPRASTSQPPRFGPNASPPFCANSTYLRGSSLAGDWVVVIRCTSART